jgi:PAS domain S-box-containing protein
MSDFYDELESLRAENARLKSLVDHYQHQHHLGTLPLSGRDVYEVAGYFKIEQQLRETQQCQEFMLHALPVVFYVVSGYPGDIFTQWVSDGVEKISGFTPNRFIEDPYFWQSRLHPDDRERVLSEVLQTPLRGHVEIEYRLQHADGSYRWLLDQATRISDETGQTKEVIGCWLDITDPSTIVASTEIGKHWTACRRSGT